MRRRGSIHHRALAIVSAGLLLATLAPAASAAEPRPDAGSLRAFPDMLEVVDRHEVDPSHKARPQGPDRLTSVIVKLDLEPLAAYDGGVQGLAPTQGLVAADRTDSAAQSAIASYERYAADVQAAFERRLKAAMPKARITHRLTWVLGGVSAIVPFDRLAQISRMPGVVRLLQDDLEQVDTDASPEFIGAPSTWSQLGGQKNAGQGVIVGVLDTGIWPEHPSFSDPDPAGKAYASPPPAPDGDRACEFNEGTQPGAEFTCNDKLIGADRFMDTYDAFGPDLLPEEFTDARDENGHGTHTSSTAAGNRQVEAELLGVDRGTVSGIAPRAHVIMYKVCGEGGCYSSDSAAAVQEAIQDGVDVINFSISGGGNPYSDAVSLAFLDAYAAGVFVAASAGNSGPGPDTVAHREPWVTTVAASTSDRHFLSTVTLSSSTDEDLVVVGATVTDGIGTTPVVYAGDAPYNDPLCQDDGPDAGGTDDVFDGFVVICDRGSNARVEKGYNVLQRGAEGMLLLNKTLLGLNTDSHWLPAVHVEQPEGDLVAAYYAENDDVQASWTPGVASEVDGDDMAGFSSRGGPDQSLGISKPDVTAPGVQILAGHTPQPATILGGPPGEFFQAIAGTSMSSPHVAGAAALLADLEPGWSPGQIRSALMTTAFQKVFKEDSVTRTDPFDDGSGRIDLRKAYQPGITFSAHAPSYFLNQHDLYHVNYPSVYVPDMPGRISLKRTATSVLSGSRTWTIKTKSPADFQIDTPPSITIAGGGQAVFKIALDATAVPLGEVRHGEIILTSGSYKARMPVTIVRGQGGAVTVDKECEPTTLAKKTNSTCTIDVQNTTFEAAEVTIKDRLPDELKIRPTTITGATLAENGVFHNTTLDGAEPANVTVDPGTDPSYFDISDFGTALGLGDESIVNVTFGGTFEFAGEIWDTLGIVSNGYAVVGGGTGADVNCCDNTDLPDPERPNNLLAPYWTDLDPSQGGEVYAAVARIGPNCSAPNHCWLVVQWNDVPEWSNPANIHTFQIWMGFSGDASPTQDITFEYDQQVGAGDGGLLTVGAENKFGNRGEAVYFNGDEPANLPADGDQWRVNSTPGEPGEIHTITFVAKGKQVGEWTNCAVVRGSTFTGRATDCVSGEVTPAIAP